MSIPPEIMALILAAQGMNGKPGSQLTSADMNQFFSPELGLLTGTSTNTGQSDEDIYASFAPNISRVKSNPEADEVATSIVDDLESGLSLPQVVAKLRQLKSGEELKDYKNYAETVSKEMGDVKSALGKKKTLASQGGLPEQDAQFDPTSQMSNVYSRLLEQAKPLTPPPLKSTKKVKTMDDVGFKALVRTLNPISLISNIPVSSRLTYRDPNAKAKKEQKFQEEQYVQANEARTKIAGQEAENVKNFLATAMQKNSLAGSPFMDEIVKRTIMKRLIENPNAINKLSNPQG